MNISSHAFKRVNLGTQIYTVGDLSEMFKQIPSLVSEEASQDDIVEVINKILSIFKGGQEQ